MCLDYLRIRFDVNHETLTKPSRMYDPQRSGFQSIYVPEELEDTFLFLCLIILYIYLVYLNVTHLLH